MLFRSHQIAGIGFAIPINTAKAVLDDLVSIGKVRRPSLGIQTLPIGAQVAEQLDFGPNSGLLVQQGFAGRLRCASRDELQDARFGVATNHGCSRHNDCANGNTHTHPGVRQ